MFPMDPNNLSFHPSRLHYPLMTRPDRAPSSCAYTTTVYRFVDHI
ncbi:unnamed protein product [Ectocarpus sp. CCAP 1310/34]|nr:unnamed protein product [Ectocarpus sp. CCAP 1310/34]